MAIVTNPIRAATISPLHALTEWHFEFHNTHTQHGSQLFSNFRAETTQ